MPINFPPFSANFSQPMNNRVNSPLLLNTLPSNEGADKVQFGSLEKLKAARRKKDFMSQETAQTEAQRVDKLLYQLKNYIFMVGSTKVDAFDVLKAIATTNRHENRSGNLKDIADLLDDQEIKISRSVFQFLHDMKAISLSYRRSELGELSIQLVSRVDKANYAEPTALGRAIFEASTGYNGNTANNDIPEYFD